MLIRDVWTYKGRTVMYGYKGRMLIRDVCL